MGITMAGDGPRMALARQVFRGPIGFGVRVARCLGFRV